MKTYCVYVSDDKGEAMNNLERVPLAEVPLPAETVQSFYDGSRSGTAEQCLRALCESHERLRMELQGAETLLEEARQQVELAAAMTEKIRAQWLKETKVLHDLALTQGRRIENLERALLYAADCSTLEMVRDTVRDMGLDVPFTKVCATEVEK